MPPNRKTPGPEEALKGDELTLEELGRIVAVTSKPKGRKRGAADPFENISPEKLQREAFFQSPVDKSAWTEPDKSARTKAEKSFEFNASGVLCRGEPSDEALHERSVEALFDWLRPKKRGADKIKEALRNWLTNGEPTEALFDRIDERLKEDAVRPELLYNQPICRLVRRDQLRYDPNYQALYQITPAQQQLTEMKSKDFKDNHDRVKRNQRVYWGLSETFQSLVALFDSDLGRGEDAIKNKKAPRTKELIRITVRENGANRSTKETLLSPAGLNKYSPLRFWSPPPSFASSVFHMLFWRSVITGKDLFGRKVDGESVQKRAKSYYVIVNYFNPAKFRIADYPNLFRAIWTLARELPNPRPRRKKTRKKDLPLPKKGRTELFYPRYFPDVKPTFQEFKTLKLSIPFLTAYPTPSSVWELAAAYGSEKPSDTISCLRRFLRDRAIELILWSTYQMEIRSIGLIPIQYLYQIDLDKDLKQFFEKMIALHGRSRTQVRKENFHEINRQVSEKLLEPTFNSKIKLKKAYGGPHRDVLRTEILKPGQIRWLGRNKSKPTPRRTGGRVSKLGGRHTQ